MVIVPVDVWSHKLAGNVTSVISIKKVSFCSLMLSFIIDIVNLVKPSPAGIVTERRTASKSSSDMADWLIGLNPVITKQNNISRTCRSNYLTKQFIKKMLSRS